MVQVLVSSARFCSILCCILHFEIPGPGLCVVIRIQRQCAVWNSLKLSCTKFTENLTVVYESPATKLLNAVMLQVLSNEWRLGQYSFISLKTFRNKKQTHLPLELMIRGKKVKQSHCRPLGFQEVEAPRFLDNRHMKVVRLPALRTGRVYPPFTHFC
jgi:hypothetical protein